MQRWIGWATVVVIVGALAFAVYAKAAAKVEPERERGSAPASVLVASIQQRPMVERRQFSGSLEAARAFVAAPKSVEGSNVSLWISAMRCSTAR